MSSLDRSKKKLNKKQHIPTYFSGSGLSTLACSQMMGSTPGDSKKEVMRLADFNNKMTNLLVNICAHIYLQERSAAAVSAVLGTALCVLLT